jgi:hypothetical protein
VGVFPSAIIQQLCSSRSVHRFGWEWSKLVQSPEYGGVKRVGAQGKLLQGPINGRLRAEWNGAGLRGRKAGVAWVQ